MIYLNILSITEITFNVFKFTPPVWVTFLRKVLSDDIETNPGDIKNGFFNFCTWNLNSLAKDNFNRVRLLVADNL